MNEQKITWNAGKITILAGSIVAFIAMFLPWSVKINEQSLGQQNMGFLGNVSLGSISIKETINGWGYLTKEAGMLSNSAWFPTIEAISFGIFGILSLFSLLVPIFCVITKRNLENKLILFPILSFVLSLLSFINGKSDGIGIGNVLFFLSAIAVTIGIAICLKSINRTHIGEIQR